MIVTKIRGGLGNQLFTYAAGRCLSVIHKSPLILDTSWYTSGPRLLSLHHFKISGRESTEDQSGSEDGIGFNQKHWNFYPEFLELSGYKFLSGWWQSERFFEHADYVIRKELTFTDSMISARAQEHFERLIGKHQTPIVAVHCRRGDYVRLAENGMFTLLSPSYYLEAMSGFPENATFLLFSDDLGWCKQNLCDPRIVYCDVDDTLLSFAMMQLCDHYIIANSSFSWWAAWLGEKSNTKVITPDNISWFGPKLSKKYETRDILPTRWTQIPLNIH